MRAPLTRVADLAEQVRGVTYGKEDASTTSLPGYLPVLRAGNITDEGLVFNDLVFVPAERISDKQKVRRHDVVIAASSGSLDVVGKAASALTDFAGGFGAFCKVLRPNSKVHPAYFAQFFKTQDYRRRVSALAAGANINNLRNEHLNEMHIPLPPLAEQRRIAEVLDRAEALRAKRRAALAQLDTLTQAIFLCLFGDAATNSIGLPIDSLGDHMLFVTSGSRGWAKFYSRTGSRFIRSLDVQMNHIGNEDIAYVIPPDNAEARRTQVTVGDVLLTITGSRIGRVALVPAELDGAYVSQHVAILRANHRRIEPRFLSFFLSLEAGGQRQIARAQYGQTKPGLNFEQIRRFQIPVPPLSHQQDFARRVAAVESLKTASRASLAELDSLFGALQHRAFQGEL